MGTSTSKIQGYYDDFGSWYDEDRFSKYFSIINELEVELIEKYAENKEVLEVGCGTGIILNEVRKNAKKAVGIDLSEGMLEHARQKGLEVQQANATEIPFDDSVFDVVYSFKVLPHVPEIRKALLEIARVVRDDGTLVLEFYNSISLKYLANNISSFFRKKVYLRYDNVQRIKQYLPDGWRIVKIRGIRIFTPFSFVHKVAFFSKLFNSLERKFCDSVLKYFGGYFVVVLKKNTAR